MKALELFCGTKSFSNVAKKHGWTTYTLDCDERFYPSYCVDILAWRPDCIEVDIVWASPPCQCFSVATIGRNWNMDYTPKTTDALIALDIVKKTVDLIKYFKPKLWFIENPMGMLRKMPIMKDLPRKTVTYCQYGDTRRKATDIWTNLDWTPRPMCKNGDKCHQSAPRGSRTGTQGLKNATERGRVPEELCEELIKLCEQQI